MKVIQSTLFAKKVKRFHKNQKKELDKQIRKILANTKISEEKKGDLINIFVYKFNMQNTRYLLAYRIKSNTLELITVGSHENYYRDLKKYLKAR